MNPVKIRGTDLASPLLSRQQDMVEDVFHGVFQSKMIELYIDICILTTRGHSLHRLRTLYMGLVQNDPQRPGLDGPPGLMDNPSLRQLCLCICLMQKSHEAGVWGALVLGLKHLGNL